ncbi:Structural maintenance of chromosomes protein 3 [Nakaseomyces bracarensis]|uniref:Structural maintenance of chromosomes protein n=1 Tax=Nakaseomyces bracarensis TaxID=273131 RepID=A0ABR4NVG5_9SACH
MYIKRVVIKGFKTYRNETVIDNFSPHHNVVLGSNGSGKSNFFAAVRFVLTNDYTNLKREERQGLIYQGAGASVMSASVEIVLHDPEHSILLPGGRGSGGDTDEIRIRRTVGLKKDDYQINDRNVTRNDLSRMLESAGFYMNNPYNIVPQGRVIYLTNANDKERLQLLEEVVGAKSFELKLQASLKQMEETEQKRTQISTDMQELEDKLEEMEREQRELEKYIALERDRKVLRYTLHDRELNDIIGQIESLDGDYNDTVDSSEKYIQELDKREIMIQQITEEIKRIRTSLKLKSNTDLVQLRSKDDDALGKIENIKLKITDFRNQIKVNELQHSNDRKNLQLLEQLINEKTARKNKILPRFNELKTEETKLKFELSDLESRQNNLLLKKGNYAKFSSREERDAWIRTQMKVLSSTNGNNKLIIEELESQRDQVNNKLTENESELEELRDAISGPNVNAEREDIEVELQELKSKYTQNIDKRKELWRREQKLQVIHDTLVTEVKENERNLGETMDRSLSSGLKNVREICEKLNLPENTVFGTIGELINVNEKYKICAEVVGGNSLFNVVVDTDETATIIMNELYRMKGGRITFVPLNKLTSNSQNIAYPPTSEYACTPLIRKIKYNEMFEPIISHLFGRTLVVKDLGDGLILAKNYKLNCITLDGDRAERSGVLTGGYFDQYKKSRLESLASLSSSKESLSNIEKELESVRSDIQSLDDDIDQINGSIRLVANKKENILMDIDDQQNKLKNKENENLFLIQNKENIVRKLESIVIAFKLNEQKLTNLASDIQKDFDIELSQKEKDELSVLGKNIKKTQSNIDITMETLDELTTEIDTLEAELNSRLIPQYNDVKSKIFESSDIIVEELIKNQSIYENEFQSLDKQRTIFMNEINEIETELENLNAEILNKEKLLEKANNQQRLLLKKLDEFQKDVEKTMIRKTTLATRKEEIQQKIREVGLLPEDTLDKFKDFSGEELLSKLNETNKRIASMRNINKRAFENYKKYHEKRLELVERAQELDDSKDSIQDLIVKLKQQKITAVDKTFEKVSFNFTSVFERIVPRGTAKLNIYNNENHGNDSKGDIDMDGTQTDNHLTHYEGVSISVSFNSKQDERLKVEQLSGGQKTVCAIALILAIQMVEPAPFYLFDEVDAALDKQYRNSVAQTIAELAKKAQFICTTFRSDMIDVADKFYRIRYQNKHSSVLEVGKQDAIRFLRGGTKMAEI